MTTFASRDNNARASALHRPRQWYWLRSIDVWSLLCSATRPLRLLLTSLCCYSFGCAQFWEIGLTSKVIIIIISINEWQR